MATNQELFEILIDGLSNLKEIQDSLIEEINGFQSKYSEDYKILNDRLDNISVQIDTTIKEAIKNVKNQI